MRIRHANRFDTDRAVVDGGAGRPRSSHDSGARTPLGRQRGAAPWIVQAATVAAARRQVAGVGARVEQGLR